MTIITHKGKVRNGAVTPMFISKWDTTQAGGGSEPTNDTIILPLVSDGNYDFYVDWGDGNRDNITTYNQSEVTHQYSNTGIYEVRIIGGITGWQFNNAGDDDKIIEISQWGPLKFVSNDNNLFYGCSNLELTATDSLTLGASNGQYMFGFCFNLGSEGDMNSWDTSSVTNMANMFYLALDFNQDIGSWDVGNVENFAFMFGAVQGTNAFNNGGSPSISGWDTSSVTNMSNMFRSCTGFNQPIGYWNISNVTSISSMLFNCYSFNQPIGQWNTSSLTNISSALYGTAVFDQDLSNWVVTGVTNAINFMYDASGLSTTNYDRTLSGWSSQAVQNGVNIDFGGSQYSTATGLAFRNALVASGWTITDGGAV